MKTQTSVTFFLGGDKKRAKHVFLALILLEV